VNEEGAGSAACNLVDSDAAGLLLLSLGHDHTEDTVLEVGGNSVLVDAGREVEAARELSDAAFGEPVLGLVGGLLGLLMLRLLHDLLEAGFVRLGFGLIFDGSLVAVAVPTRLALGDGTSGGVVFDGATGGRASRVGALNLAANKHGLRLGEFDVDVVLAHARKLAMELVGFTSLTNVELRLPVLEARSATLTAGWSALTRIVVKVIKKAEEGGERRVVGGVVEVAWEESHCADLVGRRLGSRRDNLEVARESPRKSCFASLHQEDSVAFVVWLFLVVLR
jgi:hypothetical protein